MTQQKGLEAWFLPNDPYVISRGKCPDAPGAIGGERQLIGIEKNKPFCEIATRSSKLGKFA